MKAELKPFQWPLNNKITNRMPIKPNQGKGRGGRESRRQLNNRCALVFPPISGGRC